MLYSFRLATLREALTHAGKGLVFLAIVIGIIAWWSEMATSGLISMLQAAGICVAFASIMQSEQRLFGLYSHGPERNFMAHLPRLPSPAAQSRQLRRYFWLLAIAPALFYQLFVLVLALSLQITYSISFALAGLGSHVLATMVCEARLQRCAAHGIARGGDAIVAWLILIGGALFWIAGFVTGSQWIVVAVMVVLPLVFHFSQRGSRQSGSHDELSLSSVPRRGEGSDDWSVRSGNPLHPSS